MTHVAPLVSAIEDTALLNLSRTFAACAARIDREASFPFANIGRLRGAGLLALTIPKRYGGPVLAPPRPITDCRPARMRAP